MYALEEYTLDEQRLLGRFFTNSDLPVFALINLPEIVKGALFARYSRTHTPLRRLFLDEFYEFAEVGLTAIADQIDDREGNSGGSLRSMRRAEELYERVLNDYGDDSVAQLGGAHLACEQVSALMTKVIERGRLAAYLEQSTRYIQYDAKVAYPDGKERFRYVIPPEIAQSRLRGEYVARMDTLFATYSEFVNSLKDIFKIRFPNDEGLPRGRYRNVIRAKACDTVRGLLPAATYSNVGVFATGQAYESMLLRMRAHPLQEVRDYSDGILTELRKVIPGFLRRVDVEDRGVRWSQYFADVSTKMDSLVSELGLRSDGGNTEYDPDRDEVRLLHWDLDADTQLVAACLFTYSDESETAILKRVLGMSEAERARVVSAYVGDRGNRRHRPGRGFERINYRFEILSDFGSFRDLQRHRMMTLEWQLLGPQYGYGTPEEVEELGPESVGKWHEAMAGAADLHGMLERELGREVAQYVVPFAYRVRYVIQLNARQAMHMIELRTGEQGHSDYRRICLKMRDQIREVAGHHAIADAMTYVDSADYGLGRLSAEKLKSDDGKGQVRAGD